MQPATNVEAMWAQASASRRWALAPEMVTYCVENPETSRCTDLCTIFSLNGTPDCSAHSHAYTPHTHTCTPAHTHTPTTQTTSITNYCSCVFVCRALDKLQLVAAHAQAQARLCTHPHAPAHMRTHNVALSCGTRESMCKLCGFKKTHASSWHPSYFDVITVAHVADEQVTLRDRRAGDNILTLLRAT